MIPVLVPMLLVPMLVRPMLVRRNSGRERIFGRNGRVDGHVRDHVANVTGHDIAVQMTNKRLMASDRNPRALGIHQRAPAILVPWPLSGRSVVRGGPVLIRILLVEDDVLQADYSRQILESQRFYVEVASSGLDAVRKILAGWFDIVLMDHNIPDFDGVAVGRIIADLIRTQGRPRMIALSAVPEMIRARERGGSSVFDAIVAKPWNPAELIDVIRRSHQTLPPSAHRTEAVQPRLPIRQLSLDGGASFASRAQAARVLVIDDDGALRAIASLALEAEGYCVEQAANGLDALMKAVRAEFDVVVIDYRIPHIDGLATGQLIFDLIPRAIRPRLVALTSTPERLVTQEAGQPSVFDEVVGKDGGIAALLAAVARCAHYKALRTRVEPPDVVRLDSIMGIVIDSI